MGTRHRRSGAETGAVNSTGTREPLRVAAAPNPDRPLVPGLGGGAPARRGWPGRRLEEGVLGDRSPGSAGWKNKDDWRQQPLRRVAPRRAADTMSASAADTASPSGGIPSRHWVERPTGLNDSMKKWFEDVKSGELVYHTQKQVMDKNGKQTRVFPNQWPKKKIDLRN